MTTSELVARLKEFVSDERYELMQKVMNARTRYMTVVLEDIYQTQNASAVLRTCECFGVQDVHVIENRNTFTVNPDVARGASKWLTIRHYSNAADNTAEALAALRADGYRIVATTPHTNDVSPDAFDIEAGKFAIVIGNEKRGISPAVGAMADVCMRVPMVGFTESLNLSVCAALIVSQLRARMTAAGIDPGLSADEKDDLMLEWLMRSINDSERIVERLMR